RDRQPKQTGNDTCFDRILTKRRRNAAFLLDADRRLQRILQNTGQTTRFLLAETPRDSRASLIDWLVDPRRRKDDVIEDDRKSMADVCLRNLAERLPAFAIEPQQYFPALVAVAGAAFGDMITS